MMLAALVDYYRRLELDPNSEIAPFGFSKQKISFCVVIDDRGRLVQFEPLDREEGRRRVPRLLIVPGGAKPSGSGVNPCFLWDNAAYMLGYQPDEVKAARTPECYARFRNYHCGLAEAIDDAAFSAVCRFLEQWTPDRAVQHPELERLIPGFGVFRLRAAQEFVHERPKILAWWRRQLAADVSNDAPVGQCLVSGVIGALAQLHEPAIKGVAGAQSSGAKIVSFNADAFESYGKTQSFNAPVSKRAAFEYCTALNSLLEADGRRHVRLGDTTLTFWTEQPTPFEDFFGFIAKHPPLEDDDQLRALEKVLEQVRGGKHVNSLGAPATPFYILGLSPNAARLSVRVWLRSTLGDVERQIGAHFRDLELVRSPNDVEFPTAFQLLRETAREAKDILPLLEGGLMRAIWEGLPYSDALYVAVLRRMKVDQRISYLRVAIVKATLQRKARLKLGNDFLMKEISVALDPERTEAAYQMGRLFAVLERAQEQALPGVNDTIKDRFFGAASSTPASVFPRLIRMNQHHLGKLERGPKVFFERLNQTVIGKVDGFPVHLNLRDQGLFAIGYYHQRQDLFTKKTSAPSNDKE